MTIKNHFFISYAGNKRNETPQIIEYFEKFNKDIKTIIEPFCGSSAVSFNIALKYPKKYNYILNDNNKHLIEIYKLIQLKNQKKLKEWCKKLDKKTLNLNKEKYKEIMNEDDTIDKYIIANKIYCIRSGLFPLKTVKESYNFYEIFIKAPIYNFLKTEKITFTNMDALECYEKYKNDINNFIFLDPPYLSLCNDFYHESNVNIYEYLYKNKITNQSAFIMLVLNKIWIIDLLFINEIKLTYSKNYFNNITRGVEHLLISNK